MTTPVMKRLPWLLIVVMFIEIGLDAMSVVGGVTNPEGGALPITLFRMVLALIFTVFAFKQRAWALISMAVMEGLTGLGCLIVATLFFLGKPDLRFVATVCLVAGLLIGSVSVAFIRTAIQWRRADTA